MFEGVDDESRGDSSVSFAAASPTTTHFSFDIDEVEFISCSGEDVHCTALDAPLAIYWGERPAILTKAFRASVTSG
jgi:hypothetical protein